MMGRHKETTSFSVHFVASKPLLAVFGSMEFFKGLGRDFFTPKQAPEPEPGPPLSVVLHPFYPQSLLLPGYEPLTIPFEQILGIFFGASALVFIAVWLASGKRHEMSMPSTSASEPHARPQGLYLGNIKRTRIFMQAEWRISV